MPITARLTVLFAFQWSLAQRECHAAATACSSHRMQQPPHAAATACSSQRMQQPPHAAAEVMPPRNAFRPPVNECAECEQWQEEISTQYYGSPSRSAVRRSEYSPTQQSAHAAATSRFLRMTSGLLRMTSDPQHSLHVQQESYLPQSHLTFHTDHRVSTLPLMQTLYLTDFAKFLAHRELLTTCLTKFDDTPENFRAWKSSFLNATQGLGILYSEELDLLVKWLGKE